MKKNNKQKKSTLLHIVKRDELSASKTVLIRLFAILIAFVVCSLVIIAVTDSGPVQLLQSMINGNFGTIRKIWKLLMGIALLQSISLAVTPAFKMKFWNLGAEGQALIGALVSVLIMNKLTDTLPKWFAITMIAVVAMICGCIWAVIPAFFKAKFGTNETLFTLMMNYIAIQLVKFSIPFVDKSGSNMIDCLKNPWNNSEVWFPKLFGSDYALIVIIAVILTVIMFVYLKYSKHGYEISVVGESENTARYIGINVKKVILRTMAISGLLCGLVGFLFAVGKDASVSVDTIGGLGFTAVMVSWLAKFNPAVMAIASFLVVFLETGSKSVVEDCNLFNNSITGIIVGIVLFFVIGCEFFAQYKVKFNSNKEVGKHE